MRRAKTVCPEAGCPELTDGGRCPVHRGRRTDYGRASRQQRGYDKAYDQERRRWAPLVARGGVHCHAPVCLMSARLILIGQAWDLGHDDERRIRGPEHQACNRSAGGKAAHRKG